MGIDVKDKVALVTGANRGIGKGLVEAFIEHGAKKIYLAVRDLKSVEGLRETYGGVVEPVYIDLTKPESISACAKVADDVDIVVNNAGLLNNGELFADSFEASFSAELEVNTFGPYRVAKAFDAILKSKPEAAFVQLNSIGSMMNFDGLTSYCASKAASYTITQALRSTWKETSIHVLSVHPGPVATDMAKQVGIFDDGVAPKTIGDEVVSALKNGDFHLYPDPSSRDLSALYLEFGKNVIEGE